MSFARFSTMTRTVNPRLFRQRTLYGPIPWKPSAVRASWRFRDYKSCCVIFARTVSSTTSRRIFPVLPRWCTKPPSLFRLGNVRPRRNNTPEAKRELHTWPLVAGVDLEPSAFAFYCGQRTGLLATALAEYPLHRKREDPEYATQSHDDQMSALAKATREAVQKAHISGNQVQALAVDTPAPP